MSELHDLYAALHGIHGERAARALATTGKRVVVVSACLLGERTRWDGGDKLMPAVVDPLLADPGVTVMPLCPEILGGMGCPRRPVSFTDRTLAVAVDDSGADRTAELDAGAARADQLAMLAGARSAVLKERSPSCGSHAVHAGGEVIPGRGRFAARLVTRGLPVLSEQEFSAEPVVQPR